MKRKKPTEEELLRSVNKPGKLHPDQFEPRILSSRRNEFSESPEDWNQGGPQESKWPEYDATWVRILVCWKRMVLGKKLAETDPMPDCFPKDEIVPESTVANQLAMSPASIMLSHPVKVLYGLHLHTPHDQPKWLVSPVEEFGLGKREAGAALAAAWRGVEKVVPSWPDTGGMKFRFRTPWMCLENDPYQPKDENTYSDHELTALRDVALWINWSHWRTFRPKPLRFEEQAEILTNWGYPSSSTAVRKVKEKVLG
jgi:hypothetical protein